MSIVGVKKVKMEKSGCLKYTDLYRQHRKSAFGIYINFLSNILTSHFLRCQFFLAVVFHCCKIDVFIDDEASFIISF